MAQLSKIIRSILRDMVVAQHEVNMYATTLSEAYKKNGRTELFPLPGVTLGEIELDFKYGIRDSDAQVEQYEINYSEIRVIIRNLSKQLSRIILDRTIENLTSLDNDGFSTQSGSMINKLRFNSLLNHDFCAFLSHRLFAMLQNAFSNLIMDDGCINQKILLHYTNQLIEDNILNHPELQEAFNSKGKHIESDLKKTIADIFPKLIKDINLKRKCLVPSVDIIVASEELAKLPEECIQTFRVKISPRDFPVNQLESNQETI